MARHPIPIKATLKEPTIEWHWSQRNNVRAFVENWFELPFTHGDDVLPDASLGLTFEMLAPFYQAKALIFELILEDTCAARSEGRVTYTQVIDALNKFRGERYDEELGVFIDSSPEIDTTSQLAIGVLQNQRKHFERERFDRPTQRSSPRQDTQYSPVPA